MSPQKPTRGRDGANRFPKGGVWVPEEREHMISEAAYYLAERRGFSPGNEMEDWLQAETEIDSLIQSGGPRLAESVEAA